MNWFRRFQRQRLPQTHDTAGGDPALRQLWRDREPPRFSRLLLAVVLGAAISLAIAAVVLLVAHSGTDLPTVDPRDTVKTGGKAEVADSRPELRVAFSAIISPEVTREDYYGLFRHVADRLGYRAVFFQRRTYQEINRLIAERNVDLALVCSGPYTEGAEQGWMELLAVPVVAGQAAYHSYILANAKGGIAALEDLKGKRFAYTDPESNSGYLVPVYALAQLGYRPDRFFGETFFTQSHDNSVWAVTKGLADGAAVDSLIWDYLQAADPSVASRVQIIWKSPPYGIPPLVVHPGMARELKERLRGAFLTLHEDPDAAPILNRLHIDRFETGSDASYDTVRQMRRWLDGWKHGIQ